MFRLIFVKQCTHVINFNGRFLSLQARSEDRATPTNAPTSLIVDSCRCQEDFSSTHSTKHWSWQRREWGKDSQRSEGKGQFHLSL